MLSIYTSGLYVGGALSLPLGGWIAHVWNRSYAHGMAPFALAGWQVAFLAVGIPGLLLALWVLTLREPERGLAEGRPSLVVRPGAWVAFARELAAIMPPASSGSSLSRFCTWCFKDCANGSKKQLPNQRQPGLSEARAHSTRSTL